METKNSVQSAVKFFVWMGAQWRELDAVSGGIRGCRGKARFVYHHRGRLKMARRPSVLHGLRALAASLPTTVQEGLHLPKIRRKQRRSRSRPSTAACQHCHHLYNEVKSSIMESQCAKVHAGTQILLKQSSSTQTPKNGVVFKWGPSRLNTIQKAAIVDVEEHSPTVVVESGKDLPSTTQRRPGPKSKTMRSNSSNETQPKDVALEHRLKSGMKVNTPLKADSRESVADEVDLITDDSDLDKSLASRKARKRVGSPILQRAVDKNNTSSSNKRKDPTPSKNRRSLSARPTKQQNQSEKRIEIVTKADIHELEADNIRLLRRTTKQTVPEKSTPNSSTKIHANGEKSKGDRGTLKPKPARKPSDSDHSEAVSVSSKDDDTASEAPSGARRSLTSRRATRGSVSRDSTASMDSDLFDSDDSRGAAGEDVAGRRVTRQSEASQGSVGRALRARPRKPAQVDVVVSSDESAQKVAEASSEAESAETEARELVIEESDVALLRAHLARTRRDFDAARFDRDERYKGKFFYAITPLVHVQRSRRLEALLREPARLPLERFAERLGLRSVSSARSQLDADAETEAEADKENAPTGPPRSLLQQPDEPKADQGDRRFSEKTKPKQKKNPTPAAPRPAAGKDYSGLEDQAVLAWVSSGDRARLVNGNSMWRDLEDAFPRLTGTSRTWQSLRNRYLRNLLPALGSLSLSPAQAQRLRAAAAVGKLYAKKRWKRNSIYDRSRREEGASGRVRRPQSPERRGADKSKRASPSRKRRRSPSPEPERGKRKGEEGKKSPSYSELLRQFTSRNRSSSPLPELEPRTRRRKLFNPNKVL